MVRPEEMQVPQNVRTQFDTSEINTDINVAEESAKESYYADKPYIPTPDPRAVNVVKKVAEGVPYFAVNDDPVCSTTASLMMRTMLASDYGIVSIMTVDELKSAMARSNEVSLVGDITIQEQLILDKDVTINLNGHKMNLNYPDNYALVAKGCDVVIEGTGSVNVTGYGMSTSMSDPGSIILNCGVYNAEGCDYLIGCFGGTIAINGGVYNGEYCVVNNFAPYYGKEGTVIVNGGTFSNSDEDGSIFYCMNKDNNVVPEGIIINAGKFSKIPEEFVADGKSIVEENGFYVVA